jgi:hypothetical protein
MTGMVLLRLIVWLKRIALALEDLNARDRLRYERDYPPSGVEPPGRRKMVIDKPTAQERQEAAERRRLERLTGLNQDEL